MVVMQKVQRLSQPSWTLMKARVRARLPGIGWRAIGSRSNSGASGRARCSRFSFCWLG